jgi:cytoskeletal protein CcmA (bactofilin family)
MIKISSYIKYDYFIRGTLKFSGRLRTQTNIRGTLKSVMKLEKNISDNGKVKECNVNGDKIFADAVVTTRNIRSTLDGLLHKKYDKNWFNQFKNQ